MRSCHRLTALTAAAVLFLAACGSDDSTTTAADDGSAEPSDPTSSGDTTTPAEPSDPSEPSDPAGDYGEVTTEVVAFEVDGARAWTWSARPEVPEQAAVVRIGGLLLDDEESDGFKLCAGSVQESLPPQCAGPLVEGLDTASWTIIDEAEQERRWEEIQEAGGDPFAEADRSYDAVRSGEVVWGSRSLTVAWPLADSRVTVLHDQPPLNVLPPVGHDELGDDELPAECAGTAELMDGETLGQFAEANPDRTDLVRVARQDGTTSNEASPHVLRVVEGHLDDVRAELTALGRGEPCLEPVTYSRSQLEATQAALNDLWQGSIEQPSDLQILSTASGNIANRVTVDVAVADRATVRALADAVDDPAQLIVIGAGEILEGQ